MKFMDRDKVIKRLTEIIDQEHEGWLTIPQYGTVRDAIAMLKEQDEHSHELQQIINDGFEAMKVATKRIKELEALLKEQEAKHVIITLKDFMGFPITTHHSCPSCGKGLYGASGEINYCSFCGQKLLWEGR